MIILLIHSWVLFLFCVSKVISTRLVLATFAIVACTIWGSSLWSCRDICCTVLGSIDYWGTKRLFYTLSTTSLRFDWPEIIEEFTSFWASPNFTKSLIPRKDRFLPFLILWFCTTEFLLSERLPAGLLFAATMLKLLVDHCIWFCPLDSKFEFVSSYPF